MLEVRCACALLWTSTSRAAGCVPCNGTALLFPSVRQQCRTGVLLCLSNATFQPGTIIGHTCRQPQALCLLTQAASSTLLFSKSAVQADAAARHDATISHALPSRQLLTQKRAHCLLAAARGDNEHCCLSLSLDSRSDLSPVTLSINNSLTAASLAAPSAHATEHVHMQALHQDGSSPLPAAAYTSSHNCRQSLLAGPTSNRLRGAAAFLRK